MLCFIDNSFCPSIVSRTRQSTTAIRQHCQCGADVGCSAGIRDHVVQAVELKFNCFFLMPVVDSFPTRLREELESAYDDDIDEVFDVTAVRNALESRLKALESELHQVRAIVHDMHICNILQLSVYLSFLSHQRLEAE